MLITFTRWLIFLHILTVLTFFLAHGASAMMAFKVRKETDFTRIRAMLDLSDSTIEIMFMSYLGIGLTGIILSFLAHVWNKGWVWVSLLLMLLIFIWMVRMNEGSYKALRKLVGLPYRQGSKEFPAESPASTEEVSALLKQINVRRLALVGYGIPIVILWLMIFKPF